MVGNRRMVYVVCDKPLEARPPFLDGGGADGHVTAHSDMINVPHIIEKEDPV